MAAGAPPDGPRSAPGTPRSGSRTSVSPRSGSPPAARSQPRQRAGSAPATSSVAKARSEAWRVRASDAAALRDPPGPARRSEPPPRVRALTSPPAHPRGHEGAGRRSPRRGGRPSSVGCGWAVSERTNIAHAAVTVPDWGQSVSPPPPTRAPTGARRRAHRAELPARPNRTGSDPPAPPARCYDRPRRRGRRASTRRGNRE